MKTPPIPPNETARQAAHICGMPMALITFIDQDRQWIKSRIGLDGQPRTLRPDCMKEHFPDAPAV